MKFSNAYDLIFFLFKKGLLSGLFLSERGEYEVETTITEASLLSLLNDIWGDWRWGVVNGLSNAIYGGSYRLRIDNNDCLEMDISVFDNILDFHGNPFDIEEILAIISDNLKLHSIDKEEYLEFQICIDLELEYENLSKKSFKFEKLKIYSFEQDDEVSNEILNKLSKVDIKKTKKQLLEYLVTIHRKEHIYDGFNLIIESNDISSYYGTGHEVVSGLKKFLESYPVDIELDLNKLEKITDSNKE